MEELLRLELPSVQSDTALFVRICDHGVWELRHGDESRQIDMGAVEPRLRRRAFALVVSDLMRQPAEPAPSPPELVAPPSPLIASPAPEVVTTADAGPPAPPAPAPPRVGVEHAWVIDFSSRVYFDQPITLALGVAARFNARWRLWVGLEGVGSLGRSAQNDEVSAFIALLSVNVRLLELPVASWAFTLEAGVEGGLIHTGVLSGMSAVDAANTFSFGASARAGFSQLVRSGPGLRFSLGAGAGRGVRVLVGGQPQLAPHGFFLDLCAGLTF